MMMAPVLVLVVLLLCINCGGVGAAPIPLVPIRILDSFDEADARGIAWWDGDESSTYNRVLDGEFARSDPLSMRVDYVKKPGYEWSFFALHIEEAQERKGPIFFSALRFRALSRQAVTILIKVQDASGNTTEQWLTISASNEWQEIVVWLSGTVDTARLTDVIFFLEPGKSTAQGTVYFDDIHLACSWCSSTLLGVSAPQPVRILDGFDADTGLIDTWWDGSGIDVYHRSLVRNNVHSGTFSQRIQFQRTAGYEWTYFAFSPERSDSKNDFSAYEWLVFWVDSSARMGILVKLEDEDGLTWQETRWITTEQPWQRVSYDLSSAADYLDLTRIKNVYFFLVLPEDSASGSFYIDDLLLVAGSVPDAKPSAPAVRTATNVINDGLQLSWDDCLDSGAVLYEVVSSDDPQFVHITFQKWAYVPSAFVPWGNSRESYHRVRSWSQLPGYGGNCSAWSPVVKYSKQNTAPRIGMINSFASGSSEGVYPAGSLIRVTVTEIAWSVDIAEATICIASESTGYKSRVHSLLDSEDGTYSYYQWDTKGLPAADDYIATVRMINALGESVVESGPAMTIIPSEGVEIAQLESCVDLHIPISSALSGGVGPNIASGLLAWSAFEGSPLFGSLTDDSIAVFGPFVRTYNTVLRGETGTLGHGWRHNYEVELCEYSDGGVGITWGDGNTLYFRKGREERYICRDKSEKYSLAKEQDGRYVLWNLDGLRFLFDSAGRLLSISDGHGNQSTLEYEPSGFLEKIEGPGGRAITLRYYKNKLVLIQGPGGEQTEYLYDELDDLVEVVDAIGNATRYKYDDRHLLASLTRPGGYTVSFSFDKSGKLQESARNNGSERFTYITDIPHGMLSVVTGEARRWDYTFDARGNIALIDDLEGGWQRFEWNENNELVEISGDGVGPFSLRYDDTSHIVELRDPLGSVTRAQYGTRSELPEVLVDANGTARHFNYDAEGNLVRYEDGLNNVHNYSYDEFGNMIVHTTPTGETLAYSYDASGNATSFTRMDDALVSWAYDAVGNLVSAADFSGHTTQLRYNLLGQLDAITYDDGASVSLERNLSDNSTLVRNEIGSALYEYDDLERLVRITDQGGYAVAYGYDGDGLTCQLMYPNGMSISMMRDRAGRTSSIEVGQGTAFTYSFSEGRRAALTLGNGATVLYSYDKAGQIMELTYYAPNGMELKEFHYLYDAAGNRIKTVANEGEYRFTYDAESQLTEVIDPEAGLTQYTYDSEHNRISVVEGGITTTYKANILNQYVQVGDAQYSYDINGNMIEKESPAGRVSFSYDSRGRLTQALTTDGKTLGFEYDTFGLRTKKATPEGSVSYVYDARGNLLAEYDDDGKMIALYVWGPAGNVPLMIEHSSSRYYYVTDALGVICGLTDASGQIVEEYKYGPYGRPQIIDPLGNELVESSVGNSLLFTANVYEPELGLYYFGARYYDPDLGRFVSPDPLTGAYSENPYVYAANNPLNLVDRFGLVEAVPAIGELTRLTFPSGDMWEPNYGVVWGGGEAISCMTPWGIAQTVAAFWPGPGWVFRAGTWVVKKVVTKVVSGFDALSFWLALSALILVLGAAYVRTSSHEHAP
jgi:RHS repeat-associated protein